MKTSRNRPSPIGAATAAAVLMLSALASSPVQARAGDPSMPCSAFSRSAGGGWRVLAPVMLDLGGRIYSPTVGTIFPAGTMQGGIEMSNLLDRECGNR